MAAGVLGERLCGGVQLVAGDVCVATDRREVCVTEILHHKAGEVELAITNSPRTVRVVKEWMTWVRGAMFGP